jgi:hypothetical protein
MKKLFITSLAALVMIFCLSLISYSQSGENSFAYQNRKMPENFEKLLSANFSEVFANDVNIKAMRHFNKQFSSVTTEKWYKISDGIVASFTDNEVETKVLYDLKGNLHCTLRTYSESNLPFAVRDLVKSKYYDYNILVVYELTYPDSLTYILKIEDGKKIKTLKVTDGEMEVIGDYVKS